MFNSLFSLLDVIFYKMFRWPCLFFIMDDDFTVIAMSDDFTGFSCPFDGLSDLQIDARLESLSDE